MPVPAKTTLAVPGPLRATTCLWPAASVKVSPLAAAVPVPMLTGVEPTAARNVWLTLEPLASVAVTVTWATPVAPGAG